jgi:WD40 repeat protein
MADPGAGEKLKVFISYSRTDSTAFADELLAGLEVAGFAPFLDRHDIVAGENWENRLGSLIEQSDTVVFVVSPEAVKSDHCVWEVNRTIELSKRLLPVIFKPIPTDEIPEKLSSLQFVSFDSGRGITRPLAELADALRQDLTWIREHTRLGALSQRWQTRKNAVALLLRGDELEDAERWLERKPSNAPEPTELLRAFLTESRRAELARLDKERQQIEEIAAAQAAREEALKKAEDAQAGIAAEQTRTATAQGRTARLLRIARWATAGIFGLAIVAGGIVSYLLVERARELARSEAQLESTQDSLNQRELDLKHAKANSLGLLSETKLSRKEIDSALRLASHGTRIHLALPADKTRASLAAAVLAVAVSQANWHFALGGHDGSVSSAAFSPDGSRIVTASEDKTARIWDAASAKEIAVLRGLFSVSSAAFSPDGSRIVTTSRDQTARIWNAARGEEIAVLRGHNGWVNSAAFSPDGSRIVTASEDRTARIWDAASAKEIAVLEGHNFSVFSAAFSPDGKRIVTAGGGTARIWDAASRKEIAVLRGHDGVQSAAFSPDGKRIITAGDQTARIWDAASAKEIAVLRGHDANAYVSSAAFSPDGSRIVTASEDRTARIWDAHLQTMPPKDLLAQSCARLAGVTKLTREEMRLAGYSDDTSEIDVCTSD